jgi:hypothetical protein
MPLPHRDEVKCLLGPEESSRTVLLEGHAMSDSELSDLRERAAHGDNDAIGELIELAAEREDFDELRRLSDGGSRDAEDQLVELAAEKEDLDELRRLASAGNTDAAEVLDELTE